MPSKVRIAFQVGGVCRYGKPAVGLALDYAQERWGRVTYQQFRQKTNGLSIHKTALALSKQGGLGGQLYIWRERRGVGERESRYQQLLRKLGVGKPVVQRAAPNPMELPNWAAPRNGRYQDIGGGRFRLVVNAPQAAQPPQRNPRPQAGGLAGAIGEIREAAAFAANPQPRIGIFR